MIFLNLINKGIPISSLSVQGKYMEIDTFNDYKLAKMFENKMQNEIIASTKDLEKFIENSSFKKIFLLAGSTSMLRD